MIRQFTPHFLFAAVMLLSILHADLAHAEGNPQRGKQLYNQRCTNCHDLDSPRIGPSSRYVYGRLAGTGGDFIYSDALKNSGIAWTETTLDQWLKNPANFLPGQRMFYMTPDAQDRADIIAYLKQAAVHR